MQVSPNSNKKHNTYFLISKKNININIGELENKSEKNINFLGKKRFCACNKSQCNKKYCECFSKGELCNDKLCSCINCLNKINSNKKNNIKFGFCCSCQKSECLKKYCECYNNGKKCNICCSCRECKNKKICNNDNNTFIGCNNLKTIFIENEKIIIDNYKLQFLIKN